MPKEYRNLNKLELELFSVVTYTFIDCDDEC